MLPPVLLKKNKVQTHPNHAFFSGTSRGLSAFKKKKEDPTTIMLFVVSVVGGQQILVFKLDLWYSSGAATTATCNRVVVIAAVRAVGQITKK